MRIADRVYLVSEFIRNAPIMETVAIFSRLYTVYVAYRDFP